MFDRVTCLKLKIYNRRIKTSTMVKIRTIKVNSIKNEEILMATLTIITVALTIIMTTMTIKICNRIEI